MKVLDTAIDVEANTTFIWERYHVFFVLLVVTAILDAMSTSRFMILIGADVESNYVVRNLAYTLGIVWGPLLGKVMQVLTVWVLAVFTPRLTGFLCLSIASVNLYAFLMNMMI